MGWELIGIFFMKENAHIKHHGVILPPQHFCLYSTKIRLRVKKQTITCAFTVTPTF